MPTPAATSASPEPDAKRICLEQPQAASGVFRWKAKCALCDFDYLSCRRDERFEDLIKGADSGYKDSDESDADEDAEESDADEGAEGAEENSGVSDKDRELCRSNIQFYCRKAARVRLRWTQGTFSPDSDDEYCVLPDNVGDFVWTDEEWLEAQKVPETPAEGCVYLGRVCMYCICKGFRDCFSYSLSDLEDAVELIALGINE